MRKQISRAISKKYEPFEDRVLILPDEPPKMTDKGLYVPDTVQEKMRPSRGVIVAVGPGKAGLNGQFSAVNAEIGDYVAYGKHAGLPYEDPETKVIYLIMRYSDIFMRMPEIKVEVVD